MKELKAHQDHQPPQDLLMLQPLELLRIVWKLANPLAKSRPFFLQQKVDFNNRNEVGSWLTRFKELDLRLVQ